MLYQVKRLIAVHTFAFYVPLELIAARGLANSLEPHAQQRFAEWQNTSQRAWFFLDAVDELKLRSGTIRSALQRVADELGGSTMSHVHAVISSRPSDWDTTVDGRHVLDCLPLPKNLVGGSKIASEQLFVDALRREIDPRDHTDEPGMSAPDQEVRQFALLPLSDSQIRSFVKRSNVRRVDQFFQALDGQDAWPLARQPLDLVQLIQVWNQNERLGTRTELIDNHITVSLKEDPDRPSESPLSDTVARKGAERLALALALTKTLALVTTHPRHPTSTPTEALDPANVLPDWTPDSRDALLRLPLFEPPAFGRFRFRHRSLQEYLAARALVVLRERGMTSPALYQHLFSRRYGVDVVIPSRRAIVAWLAIGDSGVSRELTRREPEALLGGGDPQALSIPDRRNLIRSLVRCYGVGGYRGGFEADRNDLRRFAHPDLADAINECWPRIENGELREILLVLIELGPVPRCAGIAEEVANDPRTPDDQPVAAIAALLACDRLDTARNIVDGIFTDPAVWPGGPPPQLARILFPAIVSSEELMAFVDRDPDDDRTTTRTDWICRDIAETIDPNSAAAGTLRDHLTDAVLAGSENPNRYDLRSNRDHLCSALAILARRQLKSDPRPLPRHLVRACAAASLFADKPILSDPVGKLRQHIQAHGHLRCEVFWTEVALVDELVVNDRDPRRYRFPYNPTILPDEQDREWLFAALGNANAPERRPIALHAILDIWQTRNRPDGDLEAIRAAIRGDPKLASILRARTSPSPDDPNLAEKQARHQARKAERRESEDRRIAKWKEWRRQLLDDPEAGFADEHLTLTLPNIKLWLRVASSSSNRHDVWDRPALIKAFNVEVADRFAKALRQHWRKTSPILWSQRPPEARDRVPHDWLWGLVGVSSESGTLGWVKRLSREEARRAATYATIEINGLASFLEDLLIAYPGPVVETIGSEVAAQLAVAHQHPHPPMLQQLAYADPEIQAQFVPTFLDALCDWPDQWPVDVVSPEAQHLAHALRVLRAADDSVRESVAGVCAERYAAEADAAGAVALTWLTGLFAADAARATEAFDARLDRAVPDYREHLVVLTLGTLFDPIDPVQLQISDAAQKAATLAVLLGIAYRYVDPEDDIQHDATFTPEPRDHAESARSFLLSTLLDTPGRAAYSAIMSLADHPQMPFRDRIRLLARRGGAKDAEPERTSAADVVSLATRYETPPRNCDDLFDLVLDRLAEIDHDYRYGDFSNRSTVRSIACETEMQRTLAQRLRDRANGAYSVTREVEVANSRRTDIRISTTYGPGMAIEVKIAEHWTGPQLKRALPEQLVGGYLRDADSNAGCLLLTCRSDRRWRPTGSGDSLGFSQLLEYLGNVAAAIEAARPELRLAVVGLDLREPKTVTGHKPRRT